MDDSMAHEWSHLFLLRLWVEEAPGGQSPWHGKVQHVVTGKVGLFDDLESLGQVLTSMVPRAERAGAAVSTEGPSTTT